MRALLILGLLSGVVAAQAEIEIFFTSSNEPYGLSDPNLAFVPTLDIPPSSSTGADGYTYALQSPLDAPEFREVTFCTPGEWLYVWLRFHDMPNNTTVQGVELLMSPPTSVAEVAYYVMDNEGWAGADQKRWNGPAPDQFTTNPAILAAVTAKGIRNTQAGALNGDSLWVGAERAALLGAVRPTADALQITANDGDPGGAIPPQPLFVGGSAVLVPEPMGLLLLVAAGGVRGRRT